MKLHGDTIRNYNKPINKRKRKATAKTKRTTQKAILERLVQHARATARSLKGE